MLRHLIFAATSVWLVAAPTLAESGDIIRELDLAYGDLPRQKLDAYMPATLSDDMPVLVFFHGGGWRSGSKDSLILEGESFAEAGVIFVAPNYRLRPAVFPQFVEDTALAVAFAWQQIRKDDGSPRRVFVGGWSAGAYNAAMVSLNQGYLGALGVPSDAVAGLIGLAGPYGGGKCSNLRCPSIFPEAERPNWSVGDFVDDGDPPMLLMVGEEDDLFQIENQERLADAAQDAGAKVTSRILADGTHGTVMTDVRTRGSVVRENIDAFMLDRAAR